MNPQGSRVSLSRVKPKTPKQFVDQQSFRDIFKSGKVPAVRMGIDSVIERSAADGTFSFVMSNAENDRMGDSVHVAGWTTRNFEKNPVLLWAHDYSTPPVGKVGQVVVEKGNLVARSVQFQKREINEFGWSIGQMYEQKFLNAVSVGFDPSELEWKTDDSGGIDFLKQDLLELSCVPVPAHPGALQLAKSKGLLLPDWKRWAESVLDGDGTRADKGLANEVYREFVPVAVSVSGDDAPIVEMIELRDALREMTAVMREMLADRRTERSVSTVDRVVERTLSMLKK